MAAISGVGGKVMNGANAVANIKNWQIDIGVDDADTTSFGATGGWQTSITTIKHWTGRASGSLDTADTNGQVAFINGLGSSFSMLFYADSTKNWAGSALLTAISPKAAATGTVDVEFQFKGTGALTFT